MPLVNAKCTNCGANLQVDNTKDAAICQYCGSAYIVEKAVNNYNTVNNIHASVVNIYGGNSADFVIRGGILEKYNGASTHVVIPNSVCYIGEGVFQNCHELKSVTIPDSVTTIGPSAFENCYALKSVTILNSVTTIGNSAFENCYALKSVTIPNSVTTIGHYAFRGCRSLESITVPFGVIHIQSAAFMGCQNIKIVNLPDSITTMDIYAFADCTSLERITLPKGLSVLERSVFKNCTSLSSIVIPKGTRFQMNSLWGEYGEYGTFRNCSRLTNVIAEDANAEIPNEHFVGTPWLEQRREKEKMDWRNNGKCDLCGGSFRGLIVKKCSKCGKNKQY